MYRCTTPALFWKTNEPQSGHFSETSFPSVRFADCRHEGGCAAFEGDFAARLCFQVLECIKISEETTTSSSRIFVKILFQELCAYMGLPRLNQRFKDM